MAAHTTDVHGTVMPDYRRYALLSALRMQRAIWQRRFWEHAIRDERDYARHVDYIHYNPVKHGYITRVVGAWNTGYH